MEEYQILMMRIREYFRKNPKATWGKHQLIKELDKMEITIDNEQEATGPVRPPKEDVEND